MFVIIVNILPPVLGILIDFSESVHSDGSSLVLLLNKMFPISLELKDQHVRFSSSCILLFGIIKNVIVLLFRKDALG